MERTKLRQREKLNFTPSWEGSIEGYTVNYIKKTLWRMKSKCDFEDLYQEAYLVFDRLKKHYHCIRTPQHFMALYKTALWRDFIDFGIALAKKTQPCFC